eukprot:scaffold3311_cov411-Prasinococcus_capsulatus_cf.AAC.22
MRPKSVAWTYLRGQLRPLDSWLRRFVAAGFFLLKIHNLDWHVEYRSSRRRRTSPKERRAQVSPLPALPAEIYCARAHRTAETGGAVGQVTHRAATEALRVVPLARAVAPPPWREPCRQNGPSRTGMRVPPSGRRAATASLGAEC